MFDNESMESKIYDKSVNQVILVSTDLTTLPVLIKTFKIKYIHGVSPCIHLK